MGMAQSESGYSCSLLCLLALLSQANSLRPSRTSRGCSDASTLCSHGIVSVRLTGPLTVCPPWPSDGPGRGWRRAQGPVRGAPPE